MPPRYTVYGITSLLLFSTGAAAQDLLRGKVKTGHGAVARRAIISHFQSEDTLYLDRRTENQKASDEVIMSVSVQNISQKKYNTSDMGGNYKIPAKRGDTIVFTSAGYKPDTAFVSDWMFDGQEGYTVYMDPNVVELPTVRVGDLSNYQLDSIKRKEEYAYLDQFHKVKLAGGKTFSDGVGLSFSPIDYFSHVQVQRRRLKKRLAQNEKDYYIDSRWSRAYVVRVTGLKGDSLQLFMYRYRPSYDFCRKASNEDILLYINSSLKKFLKKETPGH
ncbi:MAG: hypothetical protein BGO55_12445 [Sphingobacteriales bacterium 50-39]|nr:hypothetical protein [Sphingobacteriales bacterium]OJW54485.1 MAG: hypothetical protein BGO55_12445 [Sphingobacteriales bacterium 50-39]